MDDAQFTYVETVDDAQAFLTWLGERHEADIVCVDLETGGFKPWRDKLRLACFGDTQRGFALAFDEWKAVVRMAFAQKPNFTWANHHVKFDCAFLEHNIGASPYSLAKKHGGLVGDSLLAAHVLFPTRVSHELKPLCDQFVGGNSSVLSRALKQFMAANDFTWATVPVDHPLYWGYGCYDTVGSARLLKTLTERMNALDKEAYDLECAVSPVMMRMELEGVEIDQAAVHRKISELEQYVEEARAFAKSAYGISNIGSDAQVIKVLLDDGVPLHKLTDSKKQFALDSEVLDEFSDHPIIAHVGTARKATKLLSTYLRKIVDPHELDPLGRVHCSIKQVGAKTGRSSITGPPLQTQPRGKFIRECFVPSPGHALISCDFSQIELRLLAHYSEDPELLASFDDPNSDPHTESARRLYRDPNLGKNDPRRQTLKNTVFAYVYGAGLDKLARTAGLTIVGMEEWVEHYDTTFRGVKRWKDEMACVARTTQVIRNQGGRMQTGDAGHVLCNYQLQGTAGEVMKRQLIALDNAGFGDGGMLFPIHDEVICEVLDDHPEDYAKEIERVMADTTTFRVPLMTEATVMFHSWGDKYSA